MSYRAHTQCRACDGTDLSEVFSYGKAMALANDFTLPTAVRKGHYPVRVLFCNGCSLAQLGETVDPEVLYDTYAYCTSRTPTMVRHFDRLVKDLISENAIDKNTVGSLCEIGANDGFFLSYARERGFGPLLGIDPATNLVARAEVPMLGAFFNKTSAQQAVALLGEQPDTVVARHCFCHQEWKPFIEALDVLCYSKTLVAIEVPYAADLLRRCEGDSIYSEHTSYLTLKAVVALLRDTHWHIHSVERYSIHGGAVLIMLRRNDSGIREHLNAEEMLAEERVTAKDWTIMAGQWKSKMEALNAEVRSLANAGMTVAGFGASAKGTMIINACGFTRREIAFVTDNTPFKVNNLVPGTDIPVIAQEEMLSEHPDYSVMFCWNWREDAIRASEKWMKRGGKFLIPTPEGVEIV